MSVTALLVDVGGVLLSENPLFWEVLRRDFHAPVDVEGLFYGPDSPWPACRTGALDYREYTRRVADELGMSPTVLVELRERHEWVLNQRMATWVRRAHQRGAKVILVSNADLTLEDRIRAFGLDDVKDAVVNSARVGSAKPDPEIYRHALALAESPPHECLFVDDREKNCAVASALGLQTLLYCDSDQFFRELQQRYTGEAWLVPEDI